MCELAEGTADAVVFLVVGGVLDGVAAEDGRVAVVVVAGVGGEVDLAEELLLVVLEFADHLVLRCVIVRFELVVEDFREEADKAERLFWECRSVGETF